MQKADEGSLPAASQAPPNPHFSGILSSESTASPDEKTENKVSQEVNVQSILKTLENAKIIVTFCICHTRLFSNKLCKPITKFSNTVFLFIVVLFSVLPVSSNASDRKSDQKNIFYKIYTQNNNKLSNKLPKKLKIFQKNLNSYLYKKIFKNTKRKTT